jgi:hypothetical protein
VPHWQPHRRPRHPGPARAQQFYNVFPRELVQLDSVSLSIERCGQPFAAGEHEPRVPLRIEPRTKAAGWRPARGALPGRAPTVSRGRAAAVFPTVPCQREDRGERRTEGFACPLETDRFRIQVAAAICSLINLFAKERNRRQKKLKTAKVSGSRLIYWPVPLCQREAPLQHRKEKLRIQSSPWNRANCSIAQIIRT